MGDPSKRILKRVACYLPIAAVGFEFVWIFVLFLALIFSVGDTPYVNTPEKSRILDTFSAWPAAAGVLFGVVVILFRLPRSEEHTSELQSPDHLVCLLLLEKQ